MLEPSNKRFYDFFFCHEDLLANIKLVERSVQVAVMVYALQGARVSPAECEKRGSGRSE
jgi:hypothetical protein